MTINPDHMALKMVARGAGVICAQIDGEVVALNIEKGVCYGLDLIGSHIWALVENPTTIEDLCATLTAHYRVDTATCERDVMDLLETLRDEGLVTVSPLPLSSKV